MGETTTEGTVPDDGSEEAAEVSESTLDEEIVGVITVTGAEPLDPTVDATEAAEDTESLEEETVG